jgi:cyclopropane-fatty-acyl-phospholipid synthase
MILILRALIRGLLFFRLLFEKKNSSKESKKNYIECLKTQPVAVATQKSKVQHYEVPTDYYLKVLGPHLKYSCAYWDENTKNLKQAEEKMLELYCERAQLKDGQKILELGCGWGSLSLFLAKKYPNSSVTAVSHSKTQKIFIDQKALEQKLNNLKVITADMNDFQIDQKFDRVISIEMFEHMKNYAELFKRVSGWLVPQGKVFVHVFCHKDFAYEFKEEGTFSWMARNFFSGGQMPSYDLFSYFQDDLKLKQQWQVNGQHYQKTCEAWLENHFKNKKEILKIFKNSNIPNPKNYYQLWTIFHLACSELFGYRQGYEWFVGHYLFEAN